MQPNTFPEILAQAAPAGQFASLPLWFRQNCQDADWVRLLAWESLQTTNDVVSDERVRRQLARQTVRHIKLEQSAGRLRNDLAAAHLQLAKVSLAMFPVALPQIARLITGRPPHEPRFQREYERFLETISAAFRPEKPAA